MIIRRRAFLAGSAVTTGLKPGLALARAFGLGGMASGAPPPPTITGITVAGSSTAASFQAATANANVGVVSVATSDSSTAAISLPSAFNPNAFQLSGSTSGSSLLAPTGGLAASPPTYPLRIQASGSYSNSPQSIDVTLTAVAAGSLQVLVNGIGPSGTPAAVISNDEIWVGVRNIPAGLGLNVFVSLTDPSGTVASAIQQVTIPTPAPPNPDLVIPLTQYNPTNGQQVPISNTPNTYFVAVSYQFSINTIQAISAGFTINPYLQPPFPYIMQNAQVGILPIIYLGMSTSPSGNLLFSDGGTVAQVNVVKGPSVTVGVSSYRSASGGVSPANVWAQFWVFGPGLPVNGAPLGAPAFAGPAGTFPSTTFDSTSLTLFPAGDGTYMIICRLIDIADGVNYPLSFVPSPLTMIIQNVAAKPIIGTYTLPTASANLNAHVLSPTPDLVTYSYSGTGPPVQTADFPYPGPGQSVVTVPPVWSPSSPFNPATGGNPANGRAPGLYGEALCNLPYTEYTQAPRIMTTPIGGVCMVPWTSEGEGAATVEDAYPPTANQNFYDGGRMSSTTTGNTNMIATPETGIFSAYHWTLVQLDGRVAVVDLTGTIKTIAGPVADTTKLPLDWQYPSNPEFPNTVFIGTVPAPPNDFDLGSANDVCWDPRNHNILYIVKPVDHCIVKADYTGNSASAPNPILTVYAGQVGVSGYVNGAARGAALFSGPYSICMQKRTDIPGHPQGTMYVADNYNSTIRMISADGSTVSTLVGLGDGNFAIPPASQAAMTTAVQGTQTFSVASITQTGSTAAIVLSGTAPTFPFIQGIGWRLKVFVNGSPYTNGGGPNIGGEVEYGIYSVSALGADSQHFSINMTNIPTSGTVTVELIASDTFSNPNPVSFATAYTALPFVIRMASTGDIVLGEAWYNIMCRRIWLSGVNAGKITRIGPTGNLADNQNNAGWGWLDVDDGVGADGVVHAYGATGPIDDIVCFKFDSNPGSAATGTRWSLDGSYVGNWPGQKGPNFPAEGPSGIGHYPWGFCFSKSQGRYFSVGKGETGLTSWRFSLPADPGAVIDPIAWPRNDTFTPDAWSMGTVPPFPFGMRPSFAALFGQSGTQLFGPNVQPHLDAVQSLYPNDYSGAAGTVLSTYIQNGAGGKIPRPEFAITDSGVPGRPLAYLIYMMRRQSLVGSYPTTHPPLWINTIPSGAGMLATPGSLSLNFIRPKITVGPTAVRASGSPKTSITVTWTTDVKTMSTIAGGSPNSFAGGTYSVWALPETTFSVTHSVTITGLPDASLAGLGPTHIAVVGISQDGSPYQSADIVVPYP